MSMTISVAMATYNGEKYIKEQLDSILHQTQRVDEIIICDDCSSDRTVEIINDYIQENTILRLYQNKVNLGYKENFKKAMSLCKGDFVFLCDQDDIWKRDKVKLMLGKMYDNPQIKVLASSFSYINQNSQLINGEKNETFYYGSIQQGEIKPITFTELLLHNYFQGCCMCLRKEMVQDFRTYYSALAPHDWLMNIMAASQNGMYFWNNPMIYYRLHDANTLGVDNIGISRWEHLKKEFTLDFRIGYAYDALNAIDAFEESQFPLSIVKNEELIAVRSFLNHLIICLKEKKRFHFNKQEKQIHALYRTKKGRILDYLFVVM